MRVAFISCSAASERSSHHAWLAPLRDRGIEVSLLVPPDEPLDVAWLRERGADVATWPMRRAATDPLQLRAGLALGSWLRRRPVDLVHAFGHRAAVGAWLALRGSPCIPLVGHLTGAGSVFTGEHPSIPRKAQRSGLRLAWRAMLPRMARVLLDNEDDRDLLPFAPAGRLRATRGPGVDVGHFDRRHLTKQQIAQVRSSLGIPPDAPLIVFVGRLIGDKGVRELAQAAGEVRRRHPQAVVLLVGGADPANPSALATNEIESLAASGLTLAGRRQDVRALLAAADIFVNPSYREGLPRTNLEAMAMALPVVTTDVRGCRDTVAHERTGLLVAPRDPDALANALLRLLADPAERQRMGAAGRQRVMERFTVQQVVQELAELYASLAGIAGHG